MDSLRELTIYSIIFRLLLSMLLGGIIGYERGLKNRAAGLRTYLLVCIGSCIIMMANQYVYQIYKTGDPVRMAAQVISGIGFLGAGTIIVTNKNQIKGLTTAAGLWASASLGLAIGIGGYEIAIAGGTSIFLILTIFNHWDARIHDRRKILFCYIELMKGTSFSEFAKMVKMHDIEMSNVQFQNNQAREDVAIIFTATFRSYNNLRTSELLYYLRKQEMVSYIEEL